MSKVNLNEIDACKCCGVVTETSRNKKTGEYLCWECQTAIEENKKLPETENLQKEISKCRT